MAKRKKYEQVMEDWLEYWPAALQIWGKFTRLSEPKWCVSAADERKQGLNSSFAMIRFPDHAIVISIPQVVQLELEDYAIEVLAHEIGHHILCPADLTDQGRMLARMRPSLPTKESLAPFVANLYADLLINDRLQRHGSLRMAHVYERINAANSPAGELWTFYMRIYEVLWRLPARALTGGGNVSRVMEADAQLAARVIRSYSRHWLDGTGRFAALCLPYLMDENEKQTLSEFGPLLDGMCPAGGIDAMPPGLAEIEAEETEGALHPSLDPALSGAEDAEGLDSAKDYTHRREMKSAASNSRGCSRGQFREPFEYGEILRSLGLKLDDHEVAVRYYRERAIPHLVPYPEVILPESTDPQPEGLEPWDVGSPLEDIDWLESVLVSPHIIPGMTTVQRTWGTCEGHQPNKRPIDLDLYVDCSGSVPNPQVSTSYLALAGAIIALSALRSGACVQATLWSGPREFTTTDGFISNETDILRVITGYLGGSTAFPLHILRDTHTNRRLEDRAAHILVISDEGCDTMFAADERGAQGRSICRTALEKARGGGTLVLNLYDDWRKNSFCREADSMGFDVFRVQTWEELEQFARAFSAKKYGQNEAELKRIRKRVP